MSHPRFWLPALPLWALLAACGGSMDGAEQMHAALSDARVENRRHETACDSATSMPAMMDELAHHEGVMGDLLERMDEARLRIRDGDGGHCMGQDLRHLSQGLDGLHGAMVEHGSLMRAAEAVVDARAECGRHTSTMAATMTGMIGDFDSMRCMGR